MINERNCGRDCTWPKLRNAPRLQDRRKRLRGSGLIPKKCGGRYEEEFDRAARILEAGKLAGIGGDDGLFTRERNGLWRRSNAHVESAGTPAQAEAAPRYHIKFAVCGMSHDHIYGMIGAVQRGGGELVAAWGGEADKLANFASAFLT